MGQPIVATPPPPPAAPKEPEPEFWILSEFQVRALNEAYRLREQLKDTLKQIEGETIYTSFKSKLGKRLQFCEYDVVPSPNGGSAILDKTNPKVRDRDDSAVLFRAASNTVTQI